MTKAAFANRWALCCATKATRSRLIASGEDCLEQLERRGFDLVLLDVWLPKMDGLATLEHIQARDIGAGCDHDFRARKYRDGRARNEAGRI